MQQHESVSELRNEKKNNLRISNLRVDVAACRDPSQLQSAILGFVFGPYRIAVSQW